VPKICLCQDPEPDLDLDVFKSRIRIRSKNIRIRNTGYAISMVFGLGDEPRGKETGEGDQGGSGGDVIRRGGKGKLYVVILYLVTLNLYARNIGQ
jgi:hypothetical protein